MRRQGRNEGAIRRQRAGIFRCPAVQVEMHAECRMGARETQANLGCTVSLVHPGRPGRDYLGVFPREPCGLALLLFSSSHCWLFCRRCLSPALPARWMPTLGSAGAFGGAGYECAPAVLFPSTRTPRADPSIPIPGCWYRRQPLHHHIAAREREARTGGLTPYWLADKDPASTRGKPLGHLGMLE